ncbi:iron-containing alcohol dehydrogenase family protein [Sabulilitoribacter arenilitoris]|uniref:Iron-containing alcohol dehydrogenase family protein n=1 Tax=Wocania arenilitoris TaxID=2044858 RepID=A0AAE3ER45_9FLAO|nr:iron-containing alcohol dehydrogenase family protein [Wocania arenilitoris]MCF7569102.1 iron-containing alcohol dehydrogenase family protein [Wocania arenilitoris]
MNYKNFPMVPRVIFGRGSFNQLNDIIAPKRLNIHAPFIFLVDDVFKNNLWLTSRIPTSYDDRIIYVSAKVEPKTSQVDELVEDIILSTKERPSGIIGIGGGTLLDLAKAVSIMLTNEGETKDYQGWDLVKNPAIYHVGIPTISGTGAEVSRTTVLTGPEKKLGINSDYTPFDQVVLDSELTKNVPTEQWFYTGMDCYIHCIESLTGTYLNTFSQSYGEMALQLCEDIFLNNNLSKIEAQEKLMMASWHGGMSIVYSQVGVAHAMSYGLSYLLGVKHGIGNCIVFDHLEEFYPEGVKTFKAMKKKHNINLPKGICSDLSDKEFDIMIKISLSLEPLWENAIGKNWKKVITPKKLKELYQKM